MMATKPTERSVYIMTDLCRSIYDDPYLHRKLSIHLSKLQDLGLLYTSQQSIVHRDLKPDNILVSTRGKTMLVVLLDRSGSLVVGDKATDPEGYSTSVTKALADLWSGNIAVIPFGRDQANVLGNRVFLHADTNALSTLRGLIDTNSLQADADTPLGWAMNSTQDLFKRQGIAPCSEVVLITDGQPTGPGARVDDICNQFTPWFKSQNIPVSSYKYVDTNDTTQVKIVNKEETYING
jgi:serine/threonine protein kinase